MQTDFMTNAQTEMAYCCALIALTAIYIDAELQQVAADRARDADSHRQVLRFDKY
jgi:hypothetical protein